MKGGIHITMCFSQHYATFIPLGVFARAICVGYTICNNHPRMRNSSQTIACSISSIAIAAVIAGVIAGG